MPFYNKGKDDTSKILFQNVTHDGVAYELYRVVE